MGRYLSGASAAAMGAASGDILLPGQLPTFGSGRVLVIAKNTSFTVPAGVKLIRARVLAGGGGLIAAGSSSFGSYCSATGGQPAVGAVPGVGGVGTGGDFQASGGPGGAAFRGGGGASGSELGNGGAGGAGFDDKGGGGGGVGGKNGGAASTTVNSGGSGASAMENGMTSTSAGVIAEGGLDYSTLASANYNNTLNAFIPHPLFAFIGSGGSAGASSGGNAGAGGGGGGAGASGGYGGHGGACGGGGGVGGTETRAGAGGVCYPASDLYPPSSMDGKSRRIGGGLGGASDRAGGGGGGYARGVFAVEPGQVIPITVAQQSASYLNGHSGGLVVLEF